jgi:HlyD family secretion protein
MNSSPLPQRRNLFRSRRGIGCIVLVVLAIIVALVAINSNNSAATVKKTDTVEVTRGTLISGITASGTITADKLLNLSYSTTGNVTQVLVKTGDTVNAGQALARLDDRSLQIKLVDAQAGLASARAKLTQLEQGNARPADLAAAQAAVKSAQAAYDASLRAGGAAGSTLVSAVAVLQKAQVRLRKAQSDYDTVGWRSDIGMLPQAVALQEATIDHAEAKAKYEAAAMDADSNMKAAATELEQAKANLAKLTTPATETDLAIQRANVTQAEQSLKQAQLNLDDAILKAPFAGIVTAVNVILGSQVSAGTTVVTMMDQSTLRVDLRLNENDAARAQVGQAVSLTIDSLIGWQAEGKVTQVAPASEVVNGVVTYPVRVSLTDAEPRLKVGMTINVNIIAARKDNVLLVPNSALLPKGAGRAVQVRDAEGQKTREVDVQVGLTDGVNTEIISGLKEGDKVIAVPFPKRGEGPFGD